MIQDIITYTVIAVAVVIAGAYLYKMFCSKKNSGCAGCGASDCLLRDKIKEKQDEAECNSKKDSKKK